MPFGVYSRSTFLRGIGPGLEGIPYGILGCIGMPRYSILAPVDPQVEIANQLFKPYKNEMDLLKCKANEILRSAEQEEEALWNKRGAFHAQIGVPLTDVLSGTAAVAARYAAPMTGMMAYSGFMKMSSSIFGQFKYLEDLYDALGVRLVGYAIPEELTSIAGKLNDVEKIIAEEIEHILSQIEDVTKLDVTKLVSDITNVIHGVVEAIAEQSGIEGAVSSIKESVNEQVNNAVESLKNNIASVQEKIKNVTEWMEKAASIAKTVDQIVGSVSVASYVAQSFREEVGSPKALEQSFRKLQSDCETVHERGDLNRASKLRTAARVAGSSAVTTTGFLEAARRKLAILNRSVQSVWGDKIRNRIHYYHGKRGIIDRLSAGVLSTFKLYKGVLSATVIAALGLLSFPVALGVSIAVVVVFPFLPSGEQVREHVTRNVGWYVMGAGLALIAAAIGARR
jgi:hypothetical protein